VKRSARVRRRLELSDIRVRYVSETSEAVGLLLNVSRAGLFVKASELPRPGSIVAIQFKSPLGPLVDARGDVRWTTRLTADRAAAVGGIEGFGVAIQEPGREFRDFMTWLDAQTADEHARSIPADSDAKDP